MPETPAFFVPEATPDMLESVYADFARMCHASVPVLGKRVYSITFNHDGEEWTATVGEPLRGIRYKTVRSQGQKIERAVPIGDPATVLAIFSGEPFTVVTKIIVLYAMLGQDGKTLFSLAAPNP